jgi:hypothetical protein
MKKLSLVVTIGILGLAAACQSATEVQPADLEGTWIASEARIVDIELPKESNFDLIELGYTAFFDSDGTGAFELRLISPEDEGQLVTGTLAIDGTDVVVTTDSTTSAGEVFVEDDQAALSITAGLTFDFKGDGTEKPAKLLLVMDRVRP